MSAVSTFLNRAGDSAARALRWVQSVPLRPSRTLPAAAPVVDHGPRVRQEALAEFYDRYEELIELLCDSAQYGPDARQEARYGELRQFMQVHYRHIRPFVAAYLEHRVEDGREALDLYGKATDAFEALFIAPTLDAQIRADDGLLIDRMVRTREALTRYAEHLRRQIAG